MKFKEFGDKSTPVIILLHGGGLSWWSLKNIIDDLQKSYYVVTPIMDGHGEDYETTFLSIYNSAEKLIEYIDIEFQGNVYALGGLSIGAQIVTEILSIRKDICTYAIIESALIYPIKGTNLLAVPSYKLFYGLTKKKWFAKLQAKALSIPDEMFQNYFEDSLKMTKQSLINITLSNGNYCLKDSIRNTTAKVLIIVGEKELKVMKKSAKTLHNIISNNVLFVAKKSAHGELSLINYREYLILIKDFIENQGENR